MGVPFYPAPGTPGSRSGTLRTFMERLPRRAIGAALLAVLALAPVAVRAGADEPAPRPAPSDPAPAPKPPIPDPEPYLAMTGATLAGVARDGSAVFVRMTRD